MINTYIPGLYGVNNKINSVIILSSSLIFIINLLLYSLNDDNHSYDNYDNNNYILYDYDAMVDSMKISGILMILFYLLDLVCNNYFWNIFGEKEDMVLDCEEPQRNRFILRPWNSHSSIFQFIAGLYPLLQLNEDTNYYYACLLFGYSHIFMGIISYLWWASQSHIIHIADNLFMELIINSLSVLVWSTMYPELELLFVILPLIYLYYHSKNFIEARLVMLAVFFISSSIYSVYIHNDSGDHISYFIGSTLSLGGLVPKILDREVKFQYGTALFHLMEGMGFLMFYKWIQSY
jgi:hypothetical protein